MNKIYEEQLKINRSKISLNESGPWKRKQRPTENPRPPQDPFAHYKPAKKQEVQKTPEEPKSELSDYTGADLAWDAASLADPTGAIDIANAARLAYKGDYTGAALSALGAVPVVGNLATVGKLAKRASSLAKVASKTDDVKWAKRLYMTKDQADAYAKASGIGRKATTKITPDQVRAAAERLISKQKAEPAKTTALAKLGKTAATSGVAAGAATIAANALERALRSKPSDDSEDNESRKIEYNDPIPDIGLNIHRLSAFEPGEASGYAKSTLTARGGEYGHAGYHPYLTGPLNIDLQRRRSSYAHQRGLPESVEDNLKLKVKRSISNYLKSREGQKLNNHLNQVRNTLN